MGKMNEIDSYIESEIKRRLKKELRFNNIGLIIILVLTIINMMCYAKRISLYKQYIEQLQETIFYQKAEIESLTDVGF